MASLNEEVREGLGADALRGSVDCVKLLHCFSRQSKFLAKKSISHE
jgi:hypothetical protein